MFISTIKLFIRLKGFGLTEFTIIEAIWTKSKLMWSSQRRVDKHVWGTYFFFISHWFQIFLKDAWLGYGQLLS